MTYPPQQPLTQDPRYAYAPAYGQQPAQPQYGAPQGTPWMPPQYGGAPAGAPPAPPVGGQAVPTSPPPLGQSGRTGQGPTAPAPRHLVGRTVIFEPIRIDETTTAKDSAGNVVLRPTAYYHLTVVDGGPLQYGDNRDHDVSKQHGMTFEVQTPCRFTNVQSDRFGIVNEVRDAIARGDMASVGVIVQGTKGNHPFLVTKASRDLEGNNRPDGDARFQAATQIWNQIFSKTFVTPEPRSLVAAPATPPPPVQYQQAPPAQQGYATVGAQQYPVQNVVFDVPPPQPYPYGGAAQPLAQIPQQQSDYMGRPMQHDAIPAMQPQAVFQQQYATGQGAAQQPTYNPNGAAYPQGLTVPQLQPGSYAQAYAEQTAPGFQTPYAAAHPGTGPYGDGPGPGYPQQPVSAAPVNPAFEAWLATLPPEQQAAQRAALAGQQQSSPGGPGI